MLLRIASLSRLLLAKIVGAEAEVCFSGGPLGGKSVAGLATDDMGVPSGWCDFLRLEDPELELAADLNVNNTLALQNTKMIKTYVQLDDRVRPLAKIIKYWTKQRILNDAGE